MPPGASDCSFSANDIERISPTSLYVQTGYLTITGSEFDGDTQLYQLGFPNREVGSAFGAYLIGSYNRLDKERVGV